MSLKPLTSEEKARLEKLRDEDGIPHIYGWPWYEWAWKFYTSSNRFNFLCAANQISKSSTQIRKAITWATDKSQWKRLWPNLRPSQAPGQFWYLYPSKPVATTEFHEKWEPEFLPRGKYKAHPVYGWQVEYKNKEIWAVHFNSGVSIYFKTYEQDTQQLQTGTVYAIFCDEELPFEHFNELRSRLTATNGYFHMVFTATLGQDEWRRTMEPTNDSEELFKQALKLQVSIYDCLTYRDGTKSHWSIERIQEIERDCATEAEVQKRVYGKFILAGGLVCPSFSRAKNVKPKTPLDSSWHVFTAVDIGTGGEKNHPAAITLIAVRPDYRKAKVFRAWRGDGIVTDSSSILTKHTELKTIEIPTQSGKFKKMTLLPVQQSYDWHSRDFFLVASAAGETFTPANKNRDSGENLLNTLFKLQMLDIEEGDPELQKLVVELSSLKKDTPKTRAKDDLYDSLRYNVQAIPFDFEGAAGEIFKEEVQNADTRSAEQKAFDDRRSYHGREDDTETITVEDELEEYQDLIENY